MAASGHHGALARSVNRVLKAQIVMAMILGAGVLLLFTPSSALAVTYGSLLGTLGTLVTARSARRTGDAVVDRPGIALLPMYAGVVQKLLIVAAGVALGIVSLGLEPAFLIAGLALVQLGYLAAAYPAVGGTDQPET